MGLITEGQSSRPWFATAIAALAVLGSQPAGANDPPDPHPNAPPYPAPSERECYHNEMYVPTMPTLEPGGGDPCAATSGVVYVSGAAVQPPYTRPYFKWVTAPATPGQPSACWANLAYGSRAGEENSPDVVLPVHGYPTATRPPFGFSLHISLLATPVPGDFLPPGKTIGETSLCLVPPGADAEPTAWNGIERPTLGGMVDLITGVPLVKTTDLELPFAGATFRLTRTRSSSPPLHRRFSMNRMDARDQWWDWLGSGWMISENPLLLVDAAIPDAIGDMPRTCWLILDAHHSIPFQQIESTGQYEAPPRFRARIEHNGHNWTVIDGKRTWEYPPTEYKVHLVEQQLTYTFVVVREDVPINRWWYDFYEAEDPFSSCDPPNQEDPRWCHLKVSSYHDRPLLPDHFPEGDDRRYHDPYSHLANPGFGIPYYALCTRIEDRYGHEVQIEYCPSKREQLDDVATEGCTECIQYCLSRGQIKYIKLKANGTTVWTLLYAHGFFRGREPAYGPGYILEQYPDTVPGNNPYYELFGEAVVDRIYVFEGDVPDATLANACLRTSYRDAACYLDSAPDPLLTFNSSGGSLPTNWLHQIRYHYDCDDDGKPLLPTVLIRTSVRSRASPSQSGVETIADKVFHYSPVPVTSYAPYTIPWLEAMYDSRDIAEVLSPEIRDSLGIPADWTVTNLARRRNSDGTHIDNVWQPEDRMRLQRRASLRMDQLEGTFWPTFESPVTPPADALIVTRPQGAFVSSVDAERLVNANSWDKVAAISFRDPSGMEQHYRLHYLMVSPPPLGEENPLYGQPFHLFNEGWGDLRPMRSIFALPYLWRGYTTPASTGLSSPDLSDPQSPRCIDLMSPRYITIVDRFINEDAVHSTGKYVGTTYDASSAVKDGQTGRRVVEINPAGFVLKQREWQFTDDGAFVSGSGLGEEFVYMTAADYFQEAGSPLPGPPQNPGDPDPYASVRGELLLVERRSVGWSAAQDQAHEGLIDFNEYRVVIEPGAPGEDDLPPRIEQTTSGIRRGTTGTKLYRGQQLRERTGSVEVTFSVEFLGPQTSLLTSIPPLQPLGPSDPPPPWKATYTYTYYTEQPDTPPTAWPISSRLVVGAPRQLRPGSDWYFPVEREFYSDTGNAIWSATGLVTDPFNPYSADAANPLASLTFTYYDRDESGRSVATVVDAVPGSYQSLDPEGDPYPDDLIVVGDFPDPQWRRIPGSTYPAGQHPVFITQFRYDGHGLSDTFFPNGRRWARRVVVYPPVYPDTTPKAKEFVLNDIQTNPNGTYLSLTPGEIKEYNSADTRGAPARVRRGEFPLPLSTLEFDHTNAPDEEPEFVEFTQIRMRPDSNGRLRQVELLERDPGGAWLAVGTVEYNDIGEVIRRREIDGTITRQTRNPLGQILRTFVGTVDTAWESEQWDAAENNMVLVERVEYGSGPHDAWLPTVTRRYTSNPSWAMDYHGEPPSQDSDGVATVTRYDWRMRPVRVDVHAKGDPASAPRLSTTLTFLDFVDRPRLIVTYGAGAPATFPTGIEPTTLGPLDPLPDARTFFDTVPKPLSIVEMRYGPDGTEVERLVYDMGWTPPAGDPSAQPPYHAERQYAGHGGQQVFVQRPGQPVEIRRLDSLGRLKESAQVLPSSLATGGEYELTRTDSVYDADGNVIETHHWERVIDDAADRLSLSNSVRTRTVNWYDVHKRLIATADLGTEQAAGYVAGATGFVRGAVAPSASVNNDVLTVDRQGVPPGAPLRIYEYDKRGNQVRLVEPSAAPAGVTEPWYTVTEQEFTSTGRLQKKIENRCDPNPNMRRETRYQHQYGRLVSMTATRTNVQVAGNKEETSLTYGADIVDADFQRVSRNNGLIGLVQFPDESTGQASGSHDLVRISYNFAGQVAEREDARGVVFRYRYDDLGRLASVQVGHYVAGGVFVPAYPDSMTPSTGDPVDRVGYVTYAYDTAGRLQTITAYTKLGGTIISQNRYTYDARGNLTAEFQSHGKVVSGVSPKTAYAWTYEPTGLTAADPGFLRLMSVTYPAQPNAPSRTVTLGYGATGSVEDELSRLAALTTDLGPVTDLAQFSYSGSGRRIGLATAAGSITQTLRLGTEIGLLGLDTYGRVADLHFQTNTQQPQTLFRAEYTYDHAGNRITAELTQFGSTNLYSQLNTYDGLGRLIKTEVGSLVNFNGQWSIDPTTRQRTDSWQLDLLGNWVGGAQAGTTGPPDAGREITDASGAVTSILHQVNGQNEITGIITSSSSGSTPTQTRYDEAGNLIFDGQYFYQYDAWNRLVQINRASLDAQDEIVIGLLLKHYTYDGLGRLIRTQSPWPDPDTAEEGHLRSERFYYDGVRRIQEVVTDPVIGIEKALASNDPELQQLALESVDAGASLDGAAAPMVLEQGLGDLGGDGPISLPTVTYLAREYVWGPGDAGLDELLVHYDHQRLPTWPVQDAGGDIVALVDRNGGNPVVIAQWRYDAYGAVLSAEEFSPAPRLHLGHKGLFLDRLDVGVGSSSSEPPRLAPYAHGVYQIRNRAYSPALGRFYQRDPNATAMVLLESSAYHGRGIEAIASAFDLDGLYGDGANLYEYLGSSPWQRRDPMGLSWDPFDVVDEYLAEAAGNTAAFLASIGQDMKAVAVVAATIASYLPFPYVGNLGDLALYALGEQSALETGAGLALGLIPGGKLAAYFAKTKLGTFLGRLGASAWQSATRLARFATRFIRGGVVGGGIGLMNGVRAFLRGCTCLDAGTAVWTAAGPKAIEEIAVGEEVVHLGADGAQSDSNCVVATATRRLAPILIVLLLGTSGEERIRTTAEHPFAVAGRGWVAATELRLGDVVLATTGTVLVTGLIHTAELRTVYNLEVEGSHAYAVGKHGVLVHNGSPCKKVKHHIFPAFRENPARRQYFETRNINVDALAKEIPEDLHRRIHPHWNREWEEFMDNNPNATKEEVFKKAAEMLERWGILDAPTVPYGRKTR